LGVTGVVNCELRSNPSGSIAESCRQYVLLHKRTIELYRTLRTEPRVEASPLKTLFLALRGSNLRIYT
jgi:hypothetical protein